MEQPALNAPVMPPTPATEFPTSDAFPPSDEKPLPVPPENVPPLTSPAVTILSALASEASTEGTPAPSGTTVTKREHALKELLSSEQTYASDLAFIRDVYIPMALGKWTFFHLPLYSTPPSSLSLSSPIPRSRFISSDSSSSPNHVEPLMTSVDVRIIFVNIAELAAFSETLSQCLEEALGNVLEDGNGKDCIGALFLEILPQMEPLYMTYITKHPNALKHLDLLPRTPALVNYLTQTQDLASSVMRACDLPSYLIRPVQRLLSYSSFFAKIVEETPNGHGDKENLTQARDQMEQLARNINEGRRRLEVVKEVLMGNADFAKLGSWQRKSGIGKAVQVGIARMKGTSLTRDWYDEEIKHVAELEMRLQRYEAFVHKLIKNIVHWAQTVYTSQMHLQAWAVSFGRAIGISEEQPSDAFNAFLEVVDTKLLPLYQANSDWVMKELRPDLVALLDTAKSPLRLLAVMHAFEPSTMQC